MLLNSQLWSIYEKYINDIHILLWSKRAAVGFATMGLIQFTSDIPSGSFARSYEVIWKSWKTASRTGMRSPNWYAWHEFEMFWTETFASFQLLTWAAEGNLVCRLSQRENLCCYLCFKVSCIILTCIQSYRAKKWILKCFWFCNNSVHLNAF